MTTYRLVPGPDAEVLDRNFEIDTLFDADSHSECQPGRAPLGFLCTRPMFLIERVDDDATEAKQSA